MLRDAAPTLLCNSVVQGILDRRAKYNNAGLAMVAVAGPNPFTERKEWSQQIITDGKATGDGKPYREDTIFDMASCSKAFAFLSVGILIEREKIVPSTGEKLTWNTKVKDVLQYRWKLQDEVATNHATLMDVAGMRLGSPAHTFALCVEYPDQAVFKSRYLRQSVGFGERFQYTNNPQIMCLVVELLTGQTYPDFLVEHVLTPLQLESTSHGLAKFRGTGRPCEGFIRTGRDTTKSGPEGWGQPRPIGRADAEGDCYKAVAV